MEWTEVEALAILRRARINVMKEGNKSTIILTSKHPGLKVWGAIDFLTNHCKYRNVNDMRREYRKHQP